MKFSNTLLDAINNSKNVAIYTHIRPDADALGSSIAMKLMLEKMGKKVDMFVDSDIPNYYVFLKQISKFNKSAIFETYDTAIALDCADLNRLGKFQEMFKTIATTINIDHHNTKEEYAKFNFFSEESSSTGEILFYLFKALKWRIDKDTAIALYSAIASDTGCFMHSNTTSNVHKIVGQLMRHNIDIDKANYYLFKRRSFGQLQLQQIALKNLRIYLDNKLAIIFLKANDFKICNIGNNESFGLVDLAVNIEKVEVGVLISEIKPNLFACSFRGKGNFDVSNIAKCFGGGGHSNASGCNIFGTCNTVINKIIRVVRKEIC